MTSGYNMTGGHKMTSGRNHGLRRMMGLLMMAMLCMLVQSVMGQNYSDELYHRYTGKKPVKIVLGYNYGPYVYSADGGQPEGYLVDLVKHTMDQLELPYTLEIKDLATVRRMMYSHQADLTVGYGDLVQSGKFYCGKDSICTFRSMIYYHKGTQEVSSLLQFTDRDTLVLQADDAAADVVSKVKVPHVKYDAPLPALHGLETGQYTYMIWDEYATDYLIRKYHIQHIVKSAIGLAVNEGKYISNDRQLIAAINHETVKLYENGYIAKLQQKWFVPGYKNNMDIFHLLVIVLFLVIFVAFLFLVNKLVRWRIQKDYHLSAEADDIEQFALSECDDYVISLNVHTMTYTNLHGNLLPDEGMSREHFCQHVMEIDQDDSQKRAEGLLSGDIREAEGSLRWNAAQNNGAVEWRLLRFISIVEHNTSGHPLRIISAISDKTDEQQQLTSIEELTNRFRLIFEKSSIGMSFYSPKGQLMETNERMRELCQTKRAEMDAHYFYTVNLFNQPPFDELLDKNNLENAAVCFYSSLLEKYLEVRTDIIYSQEGNVQFIVVSLRDVTIEHDMYEQYRNNQMETEKANRRISLYENQLKYLLSTNKMLVWRANYQERILRFYTNLNECLSAISYDDLVKYVIDDTGKVDEIMSHTLEYFSKPFSYVRPCKNLVYHDDKVYWYAMSSVPKTDEQGNHIGCFGILRDITSIMEEQQRLKVETQRANDSGQMKSVFLANMTHEIRTPLNAIIGFCDLLQSVDTLEERVEMTKIISNNCDMLLRLINDILTISSLNDGALSLHPHELDLASSFNEMYKSLKKYVEEPVQFLCDNPYQVCRTRLDKERITQVIINFVTNAAKNTHQGHITIGYREQDDGLYFYCEDTGKRIPQDKCDKIFERFVKLNDYVQGTGLGLSICKAIAQQSGGRIGVKSQVGQGSTFWIWIPCELIQLQPLDEKK